MKQLLSPVQRGSCAALTLTIYVLHSFRPASASTVLLTLFNRLQSENAGRFFFFLSCTVSCDRGRNVALELSLEMSAPQDVVLKVGEPFCWRFCHFFCPAIVRIRLAFYLQTHEIRFKQRWKLDPLAPSCSIARIAAYTGHRRGRSCDWKDEHYQAHDYKQLQRGARVRKSGASFQATFSFSTLPHCAPQ